MRHRFRIMDFALAGIAVLAVLYIVTAYDLFANGQSRSPEARELEIDELIALTGVFLMGMVWAVRRLLRERRETARRLSVEREIRKLAYHDPLTGLPNRRQFDDALKAASASPPAANACHGVFMLDLNGFKRINDVFGHAVGDEVLLQVGSRVQRAVREKDLVARLGGDEFAVLATHIAGPEAAAGLAMRIIEELEPVISAGSREHAVRTAIGIALTPQDGVDPSELLRKADISLYRAKTQGNSAMRFFEEDMDSHIRERDTIEHALRLAIADQAIEAFYQPLVDLKNGHVRGFECLARWNDPDLGAVSPARFIPIAEDSGLIGPLTDYLLEQACLTATKWGGDVELAFNISPVLLHDPNFGMKVISLLHRTGLSPRRLELEITESALVRDLDVAQAALGSLRAAGIRIALDDFGTGYSSLYHLRNFKVDRIKIDRSFISSMATDSDSAAIVKALVGLGAGLGLDVTAEGVETDEQTRMLAEDGCQQAQGYFYSRAVSADGAARLLDETRLGNRRAS